MRMLDCGGAGNPVPQAEQPAGIPLHFLECEPSQRCSRLQQRNATPQQDRVKDDLHEVHLVGRQ
jgi:hypothetical protein